MEFVYSIGIGVLGALKLAYDLASRVRSLIADYRTGDDEEQKGEAGAFFMDLGDTRDYKQSPRYDRRRRR